MQHVVRPCDLSPVEASLRKVSAPTSFLPAILAARDGGDSDAGRGSLYVRISFRGQAGPHAVFLDVDDNRTTGWWSNGRPESGSGWDLMVGEDGGLRRHEGAPTADTWTPIRSDGYARSESGGGSDLQIPADLLGTGPRIRVGVRVTGRGWTPGACLPGAAYPPAPEPSPVFAAIPKRLALHLGERPWTVRDSSSAAAAADVFGAFAHVVLGGGLQATGHPGHGQAAALVAALRSRHSASELWGRVSAVGTGAEPIAEDVEAILGHARAWRAMGATGIYLDDAGLCRPEWQPCPYGPDGQPVALTRERQRRIVGGIHSLGLAVLARARAAIDLVGSADGLDSPLEGARIGRAADMVLVFTPTLSAGAVVTGPDAELAAANLELARSARATLGVRVAAIDTLGGPVDDGVSRTTMFLRAWTRVRDAAVDAYGITNASCSATPEMEGNLAIPVWPR